MTLARRTRTRSARRSGFTLLEVLLASAIAVLLLAGLYVAFDLTLTRAEASREQSARADLARAVVNRIGLDLSSSLGPMCPKSGGGNASSSGTSTTTTDSAASTDSGSTTGTTGTTGSTSGTTSTTGSTTGTASSTGSGSTSTTGSTSTATSDGTTATTDPAEDPEAMLAADVPFQAGVVGNETQVTLFASRVPVSLTDPNAASMMDEVLPADLRRVTYYLGSNGGLCRQERPWVTADGVRNSADPDRSDEAADIVAPEVKNVSFEYFDGSGWAGVWDGSTANSDGKSVIGPPRAIRVTLTFEFPEMDGQVTTKTVQQVYAVRAANGTTPPPLADDTATDETATSGTTGTTTTGGM